MASINFKKGIKMLDNLTIKEAKQLFSQMTYLIATTRSHQKPKKKGNEMVTCDRFRIILPTMSTFHLDYKRYSDMYMNVLNSLGIDEADKIQLHQLNHLQQAQEYCIYSERGYNGLKYAQHKEQPQPTSD